MGEGKGNPMFERCRRKIQVLVLSSPYLYLHDCYLTSDNSYIFAFLLDRAYSGVLLRSQKYQFLLSLAMKVTKISHDGKISLAEQLLRLSR